MKIVIDRAIPFLEGVFEPFAEVAYLEGRAISAADVRDAEALIVRTRTRCDASLLAGSRVRLIATATIGFDHIDMNWCRAHGVIVTTAAGCNARGVLQWVAATLALMAEREGFVPQQRTLGIVGVGSVGRLVKEYAEAWGFRVLCCDPPREAREHLGFLSLEEVMEQSDILTLHVPLNATTHHMIHRENVALLHSGATIINASRGEVVATEALLRKDLQCAVDVWENEPNIDARLLDKAFVATPHVAGYSLQGKANASAMSVRAVASFLGMPLMNWYPEGVEHSSPKEISWEQMCGLIGEFCDLKKESEPLKCGTADFESLRNRYAYRREFF
ncbi:MAG: 4-phosphoerythronate dehydrogenase [Alistipes sp.]|nr:4-phosphoerythronate dehydrogenase [Alistipes sp.]